MSVRDWLSIADLHTGGRQGAAEDFERMATRHDRLAEATSGRQARQAASMARELRQAAARLHAERGRSL